MSEQEQVLADLGVGEDWDTWLAKVLTVLPDAEVGEDNDGQIVVYTGCREKRIAYGSAEACRVVPFDA